MTWADQLTALPEAERAAIVSAMPPEQKIALAYLWRAWRRPSQVPPPGDWRFWLILSGRGWGKTRVGAEMVRAWASSGRYKHVNIIGATVDDIRDICIEGESGVLEVCPNHERPKYVPSKRRLEWPNGCRSLLFSADEPERLRGKQHQAIWADELASWRKDGKAWDQAILGLRLPPDPRGVITTTPKPLQLLRELMADPATVVTRGSTYDNRANLDPEFYKRVITKFEGTYTGRQELGGELLEESEGALWRRSWIDENRMEERPQTVHRVAIGVDPPGGATECGIVAAALVKGDPDHFYTLGDWSEKISPALWGAKAVRMAQAFGADVIAAEKNYGGDMVAATIATAATEPEFEGYSVPRVEMVQATRGKAIRAEPWSAKAQQGRDHHVGTLADLEDELCSWEPGKKSPNRLDAKVWALAALDMKPAGAGGIRRFDF